MPIILAYFLRRVGEASPRVLPVESFGLLATDTGFAAAEGGDEVADAFGVDFTAVCDAGYSTWHVGKGWRGSQ